MLERIAIAVTAIAFSASVLHAALPTSPDVDVSAPASLTGQLLIATPAMRGSPFEHSVILMAQHSKDGALGIVINKPLDVRPIVTLLDSFGVDTSGVTGNVAVYLGGPVSPQSAFAVHSAAYHRDGTVDIDSRVALSGAPDVLRDIGLGKGPDKSLIAFGYAGWGPSQLDDEVARGDWYSVPEDPSLVFDDDRTKVWSDAMARHR